MGAPQTLDTIVAESAYTGVFVEPRCAGNVGHPAEQSLCKPGRHNHGLHSCQGSPVANAQLMHTCFVLSVPEEAPLVLDHTVCLAGSKLLSPKVTSGGTAVTLLPISVEDSTSTAGDTHVS